MLVSYCILYKLNTTNGMQKRGQLHQCQIYNYSWIENLEKIQSHILEVATGVGFVFAWAMAKQNAQLLKFSRCKEMRLQLPNRVFASTHIKVELKNVVGRLELPF